MKRNLEHITCKNACTFCDHDNIMIICKVTMRMCHDIVAEGLCAENNKPANIETTEEPTILDMLNIAG